MAKKKDRYSSAPVPRTAPLTDRERGMQAFGRGDYSAAIMAWTKVLRAEPSEAVERALAEAHFRHACQNLRGASALEDLQTAVDLLPDDPLYRYHLGLAYQRQGDSARAISTYREALHHDPYYARAAYPLCLALAEQGDNPADDPAWDLLTPAQRDRLQPTDDAFAQALAALTQGNLAKAERLLQHALTLFPRLAHYYLGVIAWRRGNTDEALANWLSARAAGLDTPALRRNLISAYTQRAIAQIDSPDLAEAVRTALKFAPDSPLLLTLRQRAEFITGNQAAASGNWERALIQWQTAYRSQPKAPRELIANLALALERLERWTEAAEMWREVARRRPRRGESAWPAQHIAQLWRHIDSLYARGGHLAKSAMMINYAIKAHPDDLTLRLALAKRHMENQNWRSAEAAITRVLEMKPGYPEALSLRAQILDEGDDLDLMIEAWEQVAAAPDARQSRLAAERLTALYAERADFYLTIEDSAAAISEYEKALSLAPNDALLHARYGVALIALDPERAEKQLEAVDLGNAQAVLMLLSALHRLDQHDQALIWLKRSTAVKPPDADLLIALGAEIFERVPKVAISYFAQALDQAEESEKPRLLTTLAVIYARHNQLTTAYEHARHALRLDAQFGPAHLNLGLWDAGQGRRREGQDHLEKAQKWAQHLKRPDIADGIEEALDLLQERYIPTLSEVLDTIDPDEQDTAMRRLMGSLPKEQV